jgi:hypothetical protein
LFAASGVLPTNCCLLLTCTHQTIPVFYDQLVVLSIMSDSCQRSDDISQIQHKTTMLPPDNPTDNLNQTALLLTKRTNNHHHGLGKDDANNNPLSMQHTMATRSSARTRQGKDRHSQPVLDITPAPNQQVDKPAVKQSKRASDTSPHKAK